MQCFQQTRVQIQSVQFLGLHAPPQQFLQQHWLGNSYEHNHPGDVEQWSAHRHLFESKVAANLRQDPATTDLNQVALHQRAATVGDLQVSGPSVDDLEDLRPIA